MFSKRNALKESWDDLRFELRDQLETSQLNSCCGVVEVGGFENFSNALISANSCHFVRYLSDKAAYEYDHGSSFGAVVATLAEYQYEVVEPILLKSGFKKVSESRNPNTKNKNRIYIKILNPISVRRTLKKKG